MSRVTGAAVVSGIAAVSWAARGVLESMGADATGDRLERMRASAQYGDDGAFHNRPFVDTSPGPDLAAAAREMLSDREVRRPAGDVPLVTDRGAPVGGGLQVTWYGHSSALVEVDGAVVLLDPVWSDRVSPSQAVGPKRLHPVPVGLEALPPVDVVLISHDHYDHLDMATIKWFVTRSTARFAVPLGVGAHLERWGVPPHRIDELDWDESVEVAGVRLVATAAQHFSGRGLRRDGTLWASWAILGPEHRAFYSGDGGYFGGFAEVGAAYGPFDVSLVQVGAYNEAWRSIHMTPEEGVATHLDVGAGVMIPVHWCTFVLAPHPWAEPIERLVAEAELRGVTAVVPRPGERVDLGRLATIPAWWQDVSPAADRSPSGQGQPADVPAHA